MTNEMHDSQGVKVDIYALTEDGEIYRCNVAKSISSVRRIYKCDEDRAIDLLRLSNYDHPLDVDDERMWIE